MSAQVWGVVREKLGDPNVLIIISCGFLFLSLLLQIIGGIVHEVNRVPSTLSCSVEETVDRTVITCVPKEGP